MNAPKCAACDGRGIVDDIDGKPRPCSRCDFHGFQEWGAARRPKPAPLIIVDELTDFTDSAQ